MDEIDLELVGGFQRLVLLAQRALDIDRVGDVLEGDQRRAVRQRHGGQSTTLPLLRSMRRATSRPSIAVTVPRSARQSASSA